MSVLMTVIFFVVPVVVVAETVLLVLQMRKLKKVQRLAAPCNRRVQRADLAALVAAQSGVGVDDVAMEDIDGFLED